jgi:hypothetical protein
VLLVAVPFVVMFPELMLGDSSSRFADLRTFAGLLHQIVSFITAGIALVLIWSHRRARSIKMIAATPAPFPAWVASVFVTAALVGLTVQGLIATLVAALSVFWNVPYQLGFLHMAMNQFADSLIMLAFLTALSVWMHPVLATLLIAFLGESTFRTIRVTLESVDGGWFVWAAKATATGLYYFLPSFAPFAGRTLTLTRSMRASVSDWRYLALTYAYAILAVSFGYVATIASLRRRPLM